MQTDGRRISAAVAQAGAATLHARRRRHRLALAAAAVLGLAIAAPVQAQSGDGYLFGAPRGSLIVRGGFSQASAHSDLFDDYRSMFTLGTRDFASLSGGIEAAVRVAPNLDLSLDLGYMRSSALSHYRNFVDQNNGEIEQTTALLRVPLTIDAKLYLTPPGRSVGRFAWIPSGVAPWVSVGGGVMNYRLSQEGDFIDPNTSVVYPDAFVSSGTTPMVQGIAGVDLNLNPRLALTGDARYLWAKRPELGSDFKGYQPLDLSGAVVSLGLTVRL